jgi:hypothetical protein
VCRYFWRLRILSDMEFFLFCRRKYTYIYYVVCATVSLARSLHTVYICADRPAAVSRDDDMSRIEYACPLLLIPLLPCQWSIYIVTYVPKIYMHAHHPCHILRDWLLHPVHPGSPRSVDFAVHVNSYLHAYEIILHDATQVKICLSACMRRDGRTEHR